MNPGVWMKKVGKFKIFNKDITFCPLYVVLKRQNDMQAQNVYLVT